ncbi:hypothetical protein PF002_g13908 [Phytophthora fragariae]|uniref:PiggyBac transposable element-derived protein 4 C-terminal zinc-ribbon domain-containing protein n=2 Tax=Phytophthora fragariae TaxID=53985 RepID=A0A6A3Z212_9STRA|nr:hypothetical protein PF002_g13908 [Phytophthora fragariae]
MAMVNAFIFYREYKKKRGDPAPDHAVFLQYLQAQLLQVTSADLIDESPQPAPSNPSGQGPSRHKLVEFPEWVQIREGVRKRPQHQCKVCSIGKKKVGERRATRFYCETCNEGNIRVYFCDRIRPEQYPGNRLTCHQIWLDTWKNGEERPPPRVGGDIQMRALGMKRRGSRVQDAGSDEAPKHEDEAKQEEEAEQEEEEAEKEDEEAEQQQEESEQEMKKKWMRQQSRGREWQQLER